MKDKIAHIILCYIFDISAGMTLWNIAASFDTELKVLPIIVGALTGAGAGIWKEKRDKKADWKDLVADGIGIALATWTLISIIFQHAQ